MKRACYCRKPEGYEIKRLKAIRKDGNIEVEPIKELDGKYYTTLNDAILSVNLLGYGVIGDLEEISKRNRSKAYKEKCGNNLMDVDEL